MLNPHTFSGEPDKVGVCAVHQFFVVINAHAVDYIRLGKSKGINGHTVAIYDKLTTLCLRKLWHGETDIHGVAGLSVGSG